MTAWILHAAGRLSAAIVGAELCQRGRGGWSGPGDLFTVESCEFQRSFHDFTPRYAAILSIEHDHFDCYPDFPSLETAFREFASRTTNDGILLVNGDCPVSRAVSENAQTSARRGFIRPAQSCRLEAQWPSESTVAGSRFTLCHITEPNRSTSSWHFTVSITSPTHFAAAALVCRNRRVSYDNPFETAWHPFGESARRLEIRRQCSPRVMLMSMIMPITRTAVKATLTALRNVIGQRRVLCISPTASDFLRTMSLMDEFAASFDDVDEVWLAPVVCHA